MRLDWARAQRSDAVRLARRHSWSGVVPKAQRGASARQVHYLQDLLIRAGRRLLTDDEVAGLSMEQAGQMITSLKDGLTYRRK